MSIKAIKALRTAQNNLAPSRAAAITYGDGELWDEYEHAIQAIEQAQKQEPLCTAAMLDEWFLAKSGMSPDTKLYTSPPQRQPLTDEQAMDAYCETPPFGTYKEAFIAGIRFIEAAHGIKENT